MVVATVADDMAVEDPKAKDAVKGGVTDTILEGTVVVKEEDVDPADGFEATSWRGRD